MPNTIPQERLRTGSSPSVLIKTGVTHTHTHLPTLPHSTYGWWLTSSSSVTPLPEVAFHAFAGQSTTSQALWNVVTISDMEQTSAGSTILLSTQTALGKALAQNNQLGRCILEPVIQFLKKKIQSKHIKTSHDFLRIQKIKQAYSLKRLLKNFVCLYRCGLSLHVFVLFLLQCSERQGKSTHLKDPYW